MNENDHPQTQFFQACRGVFEGGGCRGAAHVGAYEAAINCGVKFSEIAGTSAGSIVAALVGAGASPAYLVENVARLDFNSLLSEPKGFIETPLLLRACASIFIHSNHSVRKIGKKGSAYSSEKIQKWVDDRLAELLPNAQRPIKFKDLQIPTWIVATDLSGRRAKIWSSQHTPDENVSFAVRCSCSIPLFFEPVESGLDLFVDGGILSNLPAFVFANDRKDSHSLGGRILGFQLESDAAKPSSNWNLSWLVKQLIDTAIDGATTIQGGLLDNVSVVKIPTGEISSTNFNITSSEVSVLLNSGRNAVREFVRNEHARLGDSLNRDVARYGDDELYDDLVREMGASGSRLLISCKDTKWFWSLFPSIALWAFNEAEIHVIISTDSNGGRESQRRSVMEKMGIRFSFKQDLPFTGFVLNRADARHDSAFVTNIDDTPYSPTGTVYVGAIHRPVIQGLTMLLEQLITECQGSTVKLRLGCCDPQPLIGLLKNGVHQYGGTNVSIALENVNLKSENPGIRLIVRRIRSFKYRQMKALAEIYALFNVPFGSPASIYNNDVYVSTITPPVLEYWGNELVAVEGNTRIYYLNQARANTVPALVVRGVSQQLPGQPVNVKEALIATYQMSPEDRIKGFSYQYFRSIEGAARPATED